MPLSRLLTRRYGIGRRGTVLILLGLIWIAQGAATAMTPPSGEFVLLEHATWLRVGLWLATGTIAILYARRPQGHDGLGFVALYLMAGWRLLAYAVGFAMWLADKGGSPRGIVGAMSWLIIITLLITIAGWREHADRRDP